MDGKVVDLKSARVGDNIPPFHPNCRCCTVPYFDDDDIHDTERAARDPQTGKTVYVEDMSYEEWKEKYVDGYKVSSSDATENTKAYRSLALGSGISTRRKDKMITVHRAVEFNNEIYISENVKLKPKQMHNINKNINTAKKLLNIENEENLPKIYIITYGEMQDNVLASYNPAKNIMFLNEYLGDEEKILELQKPFACPNDERSTYLHEYIHWTDAESYRENMVILHQRMII